MSDQEAATGQALPLLIKKRIIPFEQDDPSIEPLFINCVQGVFLGDDIYLDVGVITLESLDKTTNAGGPGDFAVLSRLVMSKRTAIMIREQINFVLKREETGSGEGPDATP